LTKPPPKMAQPTHRQNEKANASQHEQPRDQNVLDIAEVVGCLEQSVSTTWMLTNARDPTVSKIQAASSVALKSAAAKPLGNQRYQLLGLDIFNPWSHKGQKVAVKGVLITEDKRNRLNVTSVQTLGATCF
jgi:hypothetical protein